VLADFISPFLRVLAARMGNGPIDPESITDPNFVNHPLITAEIIAECMANVSYDPKFWEALAPFPSAGQWQVLDRLSRKQKLVFVTHRYERETYDIGKVTRDWLIGKLNVKLFVDDRHENCRDVAENTEAVVLMPDRSYNQSFNHPRVQRIQDLDELLVYLE
jgi:hypothetical protein